MNRIIKSLAMVAMVMPLLLPASIASADTLDNVKKAGKIRIAMDLGIPPWSYKDENLKNTGSEVENATLFAKDLGVELEIVPTTGANRIPFLLSNKADIVLSTLSITPEREKIILFSKPYSGANNVVSAPKSMDIKSIADLAGKRIGVTRGTNPDALVTAKAPAGTEIVRFEDESTTITSVVTNQISIIAQTEALVPVINAKNPTLELEPKFVLETTLYGMGIRKGDEALKAWADQWVRTNLANGKLNEIYKKYQKRDVPAPVVDASK